MYGPNLFKSPLNFFESQIFGPYIFSGPNTFLTKDFFIKVFFPAKFSWGPKLFLEPTFFLTQNLLLGPILFNFLVTNFKPGKPNFYCSAWA